MTREEFKQLHDCDICRGCDLKPACRTEPNIGCQGTERRRREARSTKHREPIDANTVLLCDTATDLDAAIRIVRGQLNSESPDWFRKVYAGLRRMQQRLEERGVT